MRIYLLGYMGSGKSTIGRMLATSLGISWIDLDDEFELRYKIAIADFFSKYGEKAFRELEQKLLAEFSLVNDIVVSTGGGSPCFYNNMNLILNTGYAIYLEADPALILSRIELSSRKRPLFQQMNEDDLTKNIEQHLESRKPFYEKANLVVNARNPNIEVITTRVREYFSPSVSL
jgi:shikimate kinase